MSDLYLRCSIPEDPFEIFDLVTSHSTTHADYYSWLLIEMCPGSVPWLVVFGSNAFVGFDSVKMRATLIKNVKPNLISIGIFIGLMHGNNIVSITLSRMAACFPEIVAEILHHREALPTAVEYTALLQIHKEYPSIARHHAVASIIPTDIPSSDIAKILDVLMVPHLLFFEQINQKNGYWKKLNNQQKAKKCSSYINISFNSKVLSESARTNLSVKYGIIVDKSISAKWNSVSQTARNWLQKNYTFDHQSNDTCIGLNMIIV